MWEKILSECTIIIISISIIIILLQVYAPIFSTEEVSHASL